jgi:hypothetical protein
MKRPEFVAIFNEAFIEVKTLLLKIIFIIFSIITLLSVLTIPGVVITTKTVRPLNARDVSLIKMFTVLNFMIFGFFAIIVFIVYLNTIGNRCRDFILSLDGSPRDDIKKGILDIVLYLKKYLILFLILLFIPAFISFWATLLHAIGPLMYLNLLYYGNIVPAIFFIVYTILYLPTNKNIKRIFVRYIKER